MDVRPTKLSNVLPNTKHTHRHTCYVYFPITVTVKLSGVTPAIGQDVKVTEAAKTVPGKASD